MSVILSILVLALCLVTVFACTAESRSHGKINALLKKMENEVALKRVVSEGRAEIAAMAIEHNPKYDKCDVDGGDGKLYWCPGDDSDVGGCCPYQVGDGDGDYTCCPPYAYEGICASDYWECDM